MDCFCSKKALYKVTYRELDAPNYIHRYYCSQHYKGNEGKPGFIRTGEVFTLINGGWVKMVICGNCRDKALYKVSLQDMSGGYVDRFFCEKHYNMRGRGSGLDFILNTTFLEGKHEQA